MPVIMHREGRPNEESTANVYRMTQSTVDKEVEDNEEFDDDSYVMHCAKAQFMHFVLQGKELPEQIAVPIYKIGDMTLLRTSQVNTS